MLSARRKLKIIIKRKTSEPRILYPTKLTFKCKGSKLSPTYENLENGVATTPFLQIYQRMSFRKPKCLKGPTGSSNLTLGYLSKRMEARSLRDLYTRHHGSSIHSSQKGEAAQVSRGMNQQNMVCPHSGIFFSFTNEGSSNTHYNMNEH